jgi:glycerol-3-phosphate acyltransferase PlsX
LSERLTLSVDAMGGDNAPGMVVEGMELSLNHHPNTHFLLFGDEPRLTPLLAKHPKVAAVTEIRHTPDAVKNIDKAAQALRSGRNSSMRLAINAVKDGEADGIVSAGNTGALMAMAKFVLRTLPGIDRPALASYFPTKTGQSLMLDLGANIDCDAENLIQFAVMGEVFVRQVQGIEYPSVGILNVGSEDLKGKTSVKEAAAILQDTDLPIKFHGFIEGDDIAAGTVNVIVTDGFTGNIALKTAEGTAKLFGSFLKESLTSSVISSIGALLAKPAINRLKMRMDPRRYNGAMLLGLNGICVKSHGGMDGLGFSNAIGVTADLITTAVNDSIKADYKRLHEGDPVENTEQATS